MRALRDTVVEVVVLTVIGLALGFGVNAVRGSGSIRWTKNYFDRSLAPSPSAKAEVKPQHTDSLAQESAGEETTESQHLDSPYQRISFEELAKEFSDPARDDGQYVFVDARSQAAYDQGHIEGAIRCDPYHVDECLDCVLEHAHGAKKVIVYCNGGNCEDSIFMCRELQAADVPCEAIFIYPGGWTEWEANDMPMAKRGDSP